MTTMDVDELNPDQEIDFCTLGMFILGKLMCLLSCLPPQASNYTAIGVVRMNIDYTARIHIPCLYVNSLGL
jgi:hypothetical protein